MEARDIMIKNKMRGVPAFMIGDETFVGLDIAKIESLVDYKVHNCPKCNQGLRVPKGKGNILVTCSKCEEKFKLNV